MKNITQKISRLVLTFVILFVAQISFGQNESIISQMIPGSAPVDNQAQELTNEGTKNSLSNSDFSRLEVVQNDSPTNGNPKTITATQPAEVDQKKQSTTKNTTVTKKK